MDISLMISIFPNLLNGAVITLKLLASSMIFGLLIGLLFAILRINKNPIINIPLPILIKVEREKTNPTR